MEKEKNKDVSKPSIPEETDLLKISVSDIVNKTGKTEVYFEPIFFDNQDVNELSVSDLTELITTFKNQDYKNISMDFMGILSIKVCDGQYITIGYTNDGRYGVRLNNLFSYLSKSDFEKVLLICCDATPKFPDVKRPTITAPERDAQALISELKNTININKKNKNVSSVRCCQLSADTIREKFGAPDKYSLSSCDLANNGFYQYYLEPSGNQKILFNQDWITILTYQNGIPSSFEVLFSPNLRFS
jgi:hypothetical protein